MGPASKNIKNLARIARDFIASRTGNVAMMFGLALVPIMICAGVGVDYARMSLQKQQMSDALDAATLAVGSSSGLTQSTAQALAQKYFDANYSGDKTNGTPNVSVPVGGFDSKGSVKIDVSYNLPTSLLKVIGKTTLPVTTSATVVWGQSKLWVALVLDNSGSMAQGDSTGTKMEALKNASKQLLTILQNSSSTVGDVQVSITPFDRNVNVGTGKANETWIDWTDWEAPPVVPGTDYDRDIANQYDGDEEISFEAWGPGDECPFVKTNGWGQQSRKSPFGFYCTEGPANNAGTVKTIPASGSYKGYICPGIDNGDYGNSAHRDRYYNGCYTSVENKNKTITVASGSSATCNGFDSDNCSCSGSGNGKKCRTQRWTHTWVKNPRSTWGGCIMDRDKGSNYDISNTAPSTTAKGFPAVNPSNCLDVTVKPLGYTWADLTAKIDEMAPNGSTNQPIGMAHGWQTLTNSTPYSPGALPANTSRYIIILSDGLNTQNRWWGDGSTEGTTEDGYIDDRMDKVCDAAKADGITVYSIFLHIGSSGNSVPLLNCATDSSNYFDLTSTSAVVTTFQQIGQSITNVRVSK
jgi:Flp pilus assembly protein TadG